MTCKQMGGPCETPLTAETAGEMMEKGASHLHEEAAKGDEDHKKSVEMMDEAAKNPEAAKEWETKFMADYEATPAA